MVTHAQTIRNTRTMVKHAQTIRNTRKMVKHAQTIRNTRKMDKHAQTIRRKMVKHAQTIRRQNGQTRSNNSWQKPFWNSTFVAKTFSEICFCVTAYDISGTIGIFTCMIS